VARPPPAAAFDVDVAFDLDLAFVVILSEDGIPQSGMPSQSKNPYRESEAARRRL
jgi:hypothetical protein